jgi:hypothetical protein
MANNKKSSSGAASGIGDAYRIMSGGKPGNDTPASRWMQTMQALKKAQPPKKSK